MSAFRYFVLETSTLSYGVLITSGPKPSPDIAGISNSWDSEMISWDSADFTFDRQ